MSTTNKLGLFYTNNCVPKIIDLTINNLKQFSDLVDIKTCSWHHIKDNPFPEIHAFTKHRHHLNIIIQILQLLHSVPPDKYKYVLFLEHDVLYPKEYFLFPDFEDSWMVNENYIGVCEFGFQPLIATHHPLHQIIMLYNNCISHFEKLLLRVIKERSLNLEPYGSRYIWRCPNPAIHINHGNHFTTHYKIYSDKYYENDDYWGSYINIITKYQTENKNGH